MKIDKNYLSTSAFAGVTPVVEKKKPSTTQQQTTPEASRIDKMLGLCRLYGIDTADIENALIKKRTFK